MAGRKSGQFTFVPARPSLWPTADLLTPSFKCKGCGVRLRSGEHALLPSNFHLFHPAALYLDRMSQARNSASVTEFELVIDPGQCAAGPPMNSYLVGQAALQVGVR
jgi:hypothetical protein